MVRVAGLKRRIVTGLAVPTNVGRSPADVLADISRGGARAAAASRRGMDARWCSPALADGRHRVISWDAPRATTSASALSEYFQAPDLPGADAARGRPRAPVPLHLGPLAQPGRSACATPGPGARSSRASRCRRCCRASSRCRRHERRRVRYIPLEDLISNHLGRPVPGHGDPRPPRVPPHPQRRRRDRGGRDREPHPGARGRAAAAPVRPADPPRDHRRHGRRHARPADQRARHHRAGGLPPARRRSTCAACSSCREIDRPDLHYPPHVPTTALAFQPREQNEPRRHLRVDPPGRRARAPPVRVVRDERAGVPRAGRNRPARARHQADALPHVG